MPLRLVTNKQLTDNVATLTTSASHSLSNGTYITISGVDSTFNGSYTVTGTPTTNTFTYSKTATNVPSTAVSPSGSAIYATIDDTGRPAYMYDSGTDTWFAVAGKVDTGRNYTWTGAHTFSTPVTISDNLTVNAQMRSLSASVSGALTVSGGVTAKQGINAFSTTIARDVAIPSPTVGTIVYITALNQQLVWNGAAWIAIEGGSGMEDIFLLMGA